MAVQLLPLLSMPFPQSEIAAILDTASIPADKRPQAMAAQKALWTPERRKPRDRRTVKVQRLEIESGQMIWYNEEIKISGFDRRTGQDRRLDMT
ncbi:MAG: hypothetical protein IID15_08935 [Candidatus Marinimicrobia bacterium]|nr:hypothetical protein [Candidatus Neomarinimicrobiota bacterium]